MLQRLRNKGARKRRERGHARHAAQTASERQATVQRKVPVNAKEWQMKPLGGERNKITADEHQSTRKVYS